jgi:hypothetical protein
MQDQASGAHTDRRQIVDAGAAQVIDGVADAGLPVPDGSVPELAVGRVTAAEIVEAQGEDALLRKPVREDTEATQVVRVVLAQRPADDDPAAHPAVARRVDEPEQG